MLSVIFNTFVIGNGAYYDNKNMDFSSLNGY